MGISSWFFLEVAGKYHLKWYNKYINAFGGTQK